MKARAYSLNIPMQRAFTHAQVERSIASSIIMMVEYAGVTGIGECIPRSYVTGETIQSVLDAISNTHLQDILNVISFTNVESAIQSLQYLDSNNYFIQNASNNVICLFEMALMDIIGQYFNISISNILKLYCLPAYLIAVRDEIMISQVCDLSKTEDEFLDNDGPFHFIKIKLGHLLTHNIDRVMRIRGRVGNHIPILIDANMAWDEEMAIEHIECLRPYHISYYEEPLAKGEFAAYQRLRIEHQAKILLDESLCNLQNANDAIANRSCDAFNIRIAKCGGMLRSIALIKLATIHGIQYQIGTQVAQTGPLIAADRHFATALNNYFTHEAGQHDRFFDNYIIRPMPSIDRKKNNVSAINGPGLGVKIDGLLDQYIQEEWHNNGAKWQRI